MIGVFRTCPAPQTGRKNAAIIHSGVFSPIFSSLPFSIFLIKMRTAL